MDPSQIFIRWTLSGLSNGGPQPDLQPDPLPYPTAYRSGQVMTQDRGGGGWVGEISPLSPLPLATLLFGPRMAPSALGWALMAAPLSLTIFFFLISFLIIILVLSKK